MLDQTRPPPLALALAKPASQWTKLISFSFGFRFRFGFGFDFGFDFGSRLPRKSFN